MNRYFGLLLTFLVLLSGCTTTPDTPLVAIKNTPTFSGTYIPVKDTDTPPMPVKQGPPVYPVALRKRGVEGSALLECIVNEQGIPTQIQCVEATAAEFAEAAVAAVSKWRFTPALKNGQVVASLAQLTMTFNLSQE